MSPVRKSRGRSGSPERPLARPAAGGGPAALEAEPAGLLAARLVEQAARRGAAGVIHLARSEARAERLYEAARALAPELQVLRLPAWDCLPYDRASPSAAAMGARMAALAAVAQPAERPRLLVASLAAALQRLPPPAAVRRIELRRGAPLDLDGLEHELLRLGFRLDARVDEPGEAALRGAVLDLFPAEPSAMPCRIEHGEGRIIAIRRYDPLTQRSVEEAEAVWLGPASEIVDADGTALPLPVGAEHALPGFYASLTTVFALMPEALLVLDPEVEEQRRRREREVAEAFRTALVLGGEGGPELVPAEPAALFLDAAAWDQACAGREVLALEEPATDAASLPQLATAEQPEEAFLDLLAEARDAGVRVALSGPPRAARALLRLAADRLGEPARLPGWMALRDTPPGCFAVLEGPLSTGFRTSDAWVVAPADVRPDLARQEGPVSAALALGAGALQPGDAVVHLDHGLGALRGVETLELDGVTQDCLRLDYANGATELVPAGDMDRLWRYGAEADGVSLDRLGSDAWIARRAEVEAQIADTARALMKQARQRDRQRAPVLQPARAAMERFARGFPHALTADQQTAITETLRDLASGRPMDRLVCGDVGFGKTEVAMRAAAAAVLCGYQVAVLAPTTVLVRQHLESFRRRFEAMNIRVEALSRLSPAAEARATREALACGEIGIAIGTQALAGREVRFGRLGLVIVDEEQRFGTRQKAMLRRLHERGGRKGEAAHGLTLTATPIPRTLQGAMIGLQSLSVIATPPARRQPIRTLQMPADDAVIRDALQREQRRGGQSFIVCPRIADIAPLRHRIRRLLPRLTLLEAHGDMPAEEIDAAMVRFADGGADALLSTNIVETGLDVPRANTMLVWHPDRFGLSQLHQLRGRVGRGRSRGTILLLQDPEVPPSASAQRRLKALEAFDRVGAGFAISARDMDLRGAGDLLGEQQAGHLKLIGIGLYQHLLNRALRQAQGEATEEVPSPELALGISTGIPADYIDEDALRVEAHARLAEILRQDDAAALEDLGAEIEDRFGPPPEPVRNWLVVARLRLRCRRLGVRRLEAGPQGVAAQLDGERLILREPSRTAAERLRLLRRLLDNVRRHRRKARREAETAATDPPAAR
ncbi:DEAD/DEAH box helicase [Teichococcus vastitatis]|uniref:Transcription-repair-coupling factor n=1 Tax=Teichococcus vastitatis TaxID=2307076 RepID=A0ABS9VZ64_9PROT|nr:DEAD/DEAH box helicase [Pseudoroseomonas vastitatis]MCI0752296.1 DEAD/DEAH box helicase [Pseudoroseomonas vastitatis]